ncbi:hypothetical protein BD410DRAFT_810592, partial [Rickenella mellea]
MARVDITLNQFLDEAFQFMGEEKGDELVDLVLCGQHGDHKLTLNLDEYRPDPDEEPVPIIQRRDFDSALGISTSLKAQKPLQLWTLSRSQDYLTKSLGFEIPLKRRAQPNGNLEKVQLHKIPHVPLGTIGDKVKVYLFLGGLHGSVYSDPIARTGKELYDLKRECLQEIDPLQASHLPPSAPAEVARTLHISAGRADYRTVDISEYDVQEWSESLIRKIEEHPSFGAPAFYFIQIQNRKASTVHPVLTPRTPDEDDEDYDDRKEYWAWQEHRSIMSIFNDLSFAWEELIDPASRWVVDVAVEIGDENCTVHWYRPGHSLLLQCALNISAPAANNLIRSSSFSEDAIASLSDAAGFRSKLNPTMETINGQLTGATYIQAYSTEKTPTYNMTSSDHNNTLDGRKLLMSLRNGGANTAVFNFMMNMQKIFDECIKKIQLGSARLEIRLPVHAARRLLMEGIPDEILRETILIMEPDIVWRLRQVRAYTIMSLTYSMQKTPKELWTRRPFLALLAAMRYLFNSLTSRPDDRSVSKKLQQVILGKSGVDLYGEDEEEDYQDDDDADDDYGPEMLREYGLAWIPRENLVPQGQPPRFLGDYWLSHKDLARVFQCQNWDQVVEAVGGNEYGDGPTLNRTERMERARNATTVSASGVRTVNRSTVRKTTTIVDPDDLPDVQDNPFSALHDIADPTGGLVEQNEDLEGADRFEGGQ